MKGFALGTVVLRSGLEEGLADKGVRAIIEDVMVLIETQ